jgi:hypothetical protein
MRRAALLFVVAAVAVVAAAVAFSSSGEPAQAALRHAAKRTLDAGSSRFSISYGDATPARGVMDYVHHRGMLRLGGMQELVFDGDVTYSRFTVDNGVIPAGKWLKGESGSGNPFDLQDRALSNPATLLDFLRTASTEVRRVGSESIDNVPTTRYEGSIDLGKIVELSPVAERTDLRAALDTLRDATGTTMRYRAWVDADGVTRRLQLVWAGTSALTIDFYDFGVPVDVSVPRSDEILSGADIHAIVQAASRGCSRSSDGSSATCLSTNDGGNP